MEKPVRINYNKIVEKADKTLDLGTALRDFLFQSREKVIDVILLILCRVQIFGGFWIVLAFLNGTTSACAGNFAGARLGGNIWKVRHCK